MEDTFNYPYEFPCRVSYNSRMVHCDSCEIVPDLLKKIDELKREITVLQRRLGYSAFNGDNCSNPECPKAGKCGGECTRNF